MLIGFYKYLHHKIVGSPSPFYGQRPPSTVQRNSPPTGHPPQSNYASDQHNNSRQIIINDYYTSQQMQNPPGVSPTSHIPQNSIGQQRIDPSKRNSIPSNISISGNPMYAVQSRPDIAYRQSPSPSCPPHQQQRQGVIQRANRKYCNNSQFWLILRLMGKDG